MVLLPKHHLLEGGLLLNLALGSVTALAEQRILVENGYLILQIGHLLGGVKPLDILQVMTVQITN